MERPAIVRVVDLERDAQEAAARRLPILVAVTRESCPYCEKLKSAILVPMLMSGEYEERVIIRELSIEPAVQVRTFGGRLQRSDAVAEKYGVAVVPTVLFLGPDGRELHKSMTGINVVEMYGFYLDRAIDASRLALRDETGGQD